MGKMVKHKAFGEGKIIAIEGKSIAIEFEKVGLKKVGYELSMDCFWCEVMEGDLKLLEASDAKWLGRDELDSVQWLPADREFVNGLAIRIQQEV